MSKLFDFDSIDFGSSTTLNKGSKKSELYNKSVFADCVTDEDKKNTRRKLRKEFDKKISEFRFAGVQAQNLKNEKPLQEFAAKFNEYYSKTYANNDYTLQSVTTSAKKESDANWSKFVNLMLTCAKAYAKND